MFLVITSQSARQYNAQQQMNRNQQPPQQSPQQLPQQPPERFGARDMRLSDPKYRMSGDFIVCREGVTPLSPPRQVRTANEWKMGVLSPLMYN